MRNKKKDHGFTLIELLVVIAIIGVISNVLIVALGRARTKARRSRALADLRELYNSIELLKTDTGLHPGAIALEPWLEDQEIDLEDCSAGLMCTDGSFPNWQGPYMNKVPLDPWGRSYRFDPDYYCRDYVYGCESLPDNTVERAILSFGPERVDEQDYEGSDNLVLLLNP